MVMCVIGNDDLARYGVASLNNRQLIRNWLSILVAIS